MDWQLLFELGDTAFVFLLLVSAILYTWHFLRTTNFLRELKKSHILVRVFLILFAAFFGLLILLSLFSSAEHFYTEYHVYSPVDRCLFGQRGMSKSGDNSAPYGGAMSRSQYSITNCIAKLAVKQNNASICEELARSTDIKISRSYFILCYSHVAKELGRPEACLGLEQEHEQRKCMRSLDTKPTPVPPPADFPVRLSARAVSCTEAEIIVELTNLNPTVMIIDETFSAGNCTASGVTIVPGTTETTTFICPEGAFQGPGTYTIHTEESWIADTTLVCG